MAAPASGRRRGAEGTRPQGYWNLIGRLGRGVTLQQARSGARGPVGSILRASIRNDERDSGRRDRAGPRASGRLAPRPPALVPRGGRHPAGRRLRKRRDAVPRSRRQPRPRVRDAPGARRQPRTARSPDADREPAPGGGRRRSGTAAGSMGARHRGASPAAGHRARRSRAHRRALRPHRVRRDAARVARGRTAPVSPALAACRREGPARGTQLRGPPDAQYSRRPRGRGRVRPGNRRRASHAELREPRAHGPGVPGRPRLRSPGVRICPAEHAGKANTFLRRAGRPDAHPARRGRRRRGVVDAVRRRQDPQRQAPVHDRRTGPAPGPRRSSTSCRWLETTSVP